MLFDPPIQPALLWPLDAPWPRRHRRIGSEGRAVALAHETGHHLGGPPHHPAYRWLSSEEQANRWAENVALPILYGARAANRSWRSGKRQLPSIGNC